MHEPSTHLLLTHAARHELGEHAAHRSRARRLARLRQLDLRAERAATRARLVRLSLH